MTQRQIRLVFVIINCQNSGALHLSLFCNFQTCYSLLWQESIFHLERKYFRKLPHILMRHSRLIFVAMVM